MHQIRMRPGYPLSRNFRFGEARLCDILTNMIVGLERAQAFLLLAGWCCFVACAGEATLEEQFSQPSRNATRPSVMLMLDPAVANEEVFTRQLEAAREAGAGGVLLTLPRADEAMLIALRKAADTCRQLGLELGVCDFTLSGEGEVQHAQKLVWAASGPVEGPLCGATNALSPVFQTDHTYRELARLAIPVGIGGNLQPHEIVDLSHNAAPTGGVWRVYRFGHADMVPAIPDGCDGKAFFKHVNSVLSTCQSYLPRTYGSTLLWYQLRGADRTELMWPRDLPEAFLKRSGLGLPRYLPALAGVSIGGDATARYVRRQVAVTIQESWRERFARNVDELVHEAGLEAGIDIGCVPVGPEEVPLYFRRPTLLPARDEAQHAANVRAGGAARALGRRYVIGRLSPDAVSATPAQALLPFPWKHDADRLLSEGATRLLVELSGGVPREDAGFRQLQIGCTYVRRCQMLLQHGEKVADFLVWTERLLPLLEGYACDYANQILLEAATVRGGCIRFESERSYAALAVSADVLGEKSAEQKVRQLSTRGVRVWLVATGAEGEEAVFSRVQDGAGTGCVVLRAGAAGLPMPDFQWQSENGGLKLRFLHGRAPGQEIYFVVNDSAESGPATCQFREIGDGTPTRWDPVSGEAGLSILDAVKTVDGRMSVPLFMAPHDACFIVFDRESRMN